MLLIMLLTLENQKLSIDQLKKRAFDPNNFSQNAKYVIEFIVSWLNGTQNFQFQTSGSTGKPKKVFLSREVLEYSARQTLDFVGWPTSGESQFLLCINPHFIGGTMVIVRALVAEADLVVVAPASRVSIQGPIFLTSMVPLQMAQMLAHDPDGLHKMERILLGGGALDQEVEGQLVKTPGTYYHTYGMTETASHVALRRLGDAGYKAIGDARFTTTAEQALVITGTVTGHQPLVTSDVVRLIDSTSFEWLGRKDFVINTGGFKVHPETVERILADQIADQFIISSVPDAKLGEKVVLVSAGNTLPLTFDALHPYERPKASFFLQDIALTPTGKIDRRKTQKNLLKNLAH